MKSVIKSLIAVVVLAGAASAETNWGVDVFKGYKAPQTPKLSYMAARKNLLEVAKILSSNPALPGGCVMSQFEDSMQDPALPSIDFELAKGSQKIAGGFLDGAKKETLPDGSRTYVNTTTNGQDTGWTFNMTVDKAGKITMLTVTEHKFKLHAYPTPATMLSKKTITCK